MEMSSDAPNDLKPCKICGRTFRPDTLERHQNICQKASQKRKVFDSKKQRAADLDPAPPPVSKSEPENKSIQKPSKKQNWREKHEDLIRTIRKSREGNKSLDGGGEETTKKRVPSDYVQCPGCKRHFNQRAAERHIPWCQQKQQQTPKSPSRDDAKEKLIARIKYRVPPPCKAKKASKKPKTAGSINKSPSEHVDREKGSYSSPPSLLDNRNTKIKYNSNQYASRKRDLRNESRSSTDSKTSSSPDSSNHIIKFKEKFPNHSNKRGIDLEESFSAEQLQELLRCSRLMDSRCPKTVPGVRLSGSKTNNWISGWNKSSLDSSTLPEVSSSELSDSWMGKLGWTRDFDASVSSSGSSNSSSSGSLPPMSRESTSDLQLLFYCHQCHHKFPLIGAKYCCECGARISF